MSSLKENLNISLTVNAVNRIRSVAFEKEIKGKDCELKSWVVVAKASSIYLTLTRP